MKAEAIKDYFIVNGQIYPTSHKGIFERIDRPPIYEVIRAIDGVPLFLEDHLARMYKSAELIDYDIGRDEKQIREDIKTLIEKNKIDRLNIKLLSSQVDKEKIFLVYNTESFYPPEDYYRKGIHTSLFHYERDNPNAKVQHSSFKEDVAKVLEDNKAFEALLVSKTGHIPEGSRSNMFFVKEGKLYTASPEEVLLGITRKHIFEVCKNLGIQIIEESIRVEDLEKIDGAFMTGTSVNVLPIATVDKIQLDSVNNKMVKEINQAYIGKMNDYIQKNKGEWLG